MTLLHPAPGFTTGDKFGARPSFTAGGIKTGAMHGGLDLVPVAGKSRTVVAAADGVIVPNRYNKSAGIAVTIWHPQLKLATGYAHLSLETVDIGQEVTAGQAIGVAGSTGASTGVHLHFDVFTDLDKFVRVDPLPLIGTTMQSTPAAPPAIQIEEDAMAYLFHPDIKAITWPNLVTNTYREDVYGAVHGYVTTYDQANGRPNAKWAWARETFVREAWAAQKLGKAA